MGLPTHAAVLCSNWVSRWCGKLPILTAAAAAPPPYRSCRRALRARFYKRRNLPVPESESE